MSVLAQQLKRPSSYTHTFFQRYSLYQPPHVLVQFSAQCVQASGQNLPWVSLHCYESISKCSLRRQNELFLSTTGNSFDLLASCDVTTKTWTNTSSVKGFEILMIARVGRQRSFCQMHWATSSLFLMLLILFTCIRLFNCAVDIFIAYRWMILYFTELNVNPYLTNPCVTKQYVNSFSTKALIFVIKMWAPIPTWQVLAFWKFLVHKMYSRTKEIKIDDIFFVQYENEWLDGKKKTKKNIIQK